MNYIILRKFLSVRDCQFLTAMILYINTPPQDLGLLDGDDKSNTWYKSNRSKNLEYLYSTNQGVMSMADSIKKELTDITGIDFSGGINEKCLPFCRYGNKGEILPHRDIDKVSGLTKPVEYVVVCNLTQAGVDYDFPEERSDELFINFYPQTVSYDGKITEDEPKDRFYPNLQKGDVIIFRNDISIHGVESVSVDEYQIGRITCGFRSK